MSLHYHCKYQTVVSIINTPQYCIGVWGGFSLVLDGFIVEIKVSGKGKDTEAARSPCWVLSETGN